LREARARTPLDEALAAAISPEKSSPEAAKSVREDEAGDPLEATAGEPIATDAAGADAAGRRTR
jgi:hypothetical protein